MLALGKVIKPSLARRVWMKLRSGNKGGMGKGTEVRLSSPEEGLMTWGLEGSVLSTRGSLVDSTGRAKTWGSLLITARAPVKWVCRKQKS